MTDRTMVGGSAIEPDVLRVLVAIHGDDSPDGDEPDIADSVGLADLPRSVNDAALPRRLAGAGVAVAGSEP